MIKLNVLVLYILAFAEGSNNWLINDWPNGKIFLPCSHLKLYIVKDGKAISPAILFSNIHGVITPSCILSI